MALPLILIVAPVLLLAGYIKLYRSRHFYADQIPCPKVSTLLGHIQEVMKYSNRGGRKDRHIDYVIEEMAADLNNPPFFLLDLRPLNTILFVVRSYEVAEQITRVSPAYPYSISKPPISTVSAVMSGDFPLASLNGEDWKVVRKRYNPGFQPKYLQTLLPGVVDRVQTCMKKLSDAAETGEVFSLGDYMIRLTFDIIGTVALDYDLKAQEKRPEDQSPAVISYMNCLNWLPRGENPLNEISPVGMLMRYYHKKVTDREVMKIIMEKIQEQKKREREGLKETKSIVNLGFQGVENPSPHFMKLALDQVKGFLFAGHDTTASVLQWAIFQLSLPSNRHFLARVRAEHDAVFGTSNTDEVAKMIINTPEEVFGGLTLTNAVIKETMRLYPPAGTARVTDRGNFSVEWNGKQVSMDNMVIYIPAHCTHRDKAAWGDDVEIFNPDRWIEGTASYKKVPEGAFRPFERGPRNCIGQELANMEARVILSMVLRKFDFTKVGLDGITEPEVYNTRQITAKPVDGMRMRVSLAAAT